MDNIEKTLGSLKSSASTSNNISSNSYVEESKKSSSSSTGGGVHGIDVVLGGQWGDEGKGKLVDILSQVCMI